MANKSSYSQPMRAKTVPMGLVFIFFFLSGSFGLIYEVAWMKTLEYRFGATVFATTVVICGYFIGLAAGAFVYGRYASRIRYPIRIYGLMEVCIAILALLVSWLMHLIPGLWSFSSSIVLLFLPTFFMGGTLPVLSRMFAFNKEHPESRVGILYGINTLGACTGVAACGFYLIYHMGIYQTLLLSCLANFLLGCTVYLIGFFYERPVCEDDEKTVPAKIQDDKTSCQHRTILLSMYFISCITALSYEVLWSRALILKLGNSTYAFSTILLVYLLGLGAGGLIGSWFVSNRFTRPAHLGYLQWGIGIFTCAGIVFYWSVLPMEIVDNFLNTLTTSFARIIFLKIGITCCVLIIPTIYLGVSFPVMLSLVNPGSGHVSRTTGLIYGTSIIGSITGAVITVFLILPGMGVVQSIFLCLVLNIIAGSLIVLAAESKKLRPLAIGMVLLIIPALLLVMRVKPFIDEGQSVTDTELFFRDGNYGAVKVFEKSNSNKFMSIDRRPIGGTSDSFLFKQGLLAILPLLLSPNPERVATIGLGTGMTLSAILTVPEVKEAWAVEIVPEVVTACALFESENKNALSDPRTTLVIDDGVRFLQQHPQSFDVIISDSKLNISYSGNAVFLSLDYYRIAHSALNDGGIFCQWIPTYVPLNDCKIIIRNLLQTFPYLIMGLFERDHIFFIGSSQPLRFDMDRIVRFLTTPDQVYWFRSFPIPDAYTLGSFFMWDRESLLNLAGDAVFSTFDKPVLAFNLFHNLLKGEPGEFVRENISTFLETTTYNEELLSPIPDLARMLVAQSSWKDLLNIYVMVLENRPRDAIDHLFKLHVTIPSEPRFEPMRDIIWNNIDPAVRHAKAVDYYNKGNNHHQPERLEKAEAYYQFSLSLDPNLYESNCNLGILFAQTERFGQAKTLLQKSIIIDPERPEAYFNLGIVYFEEKNFAEARKNWEKVKLIAPDYPKLSGFLEQLN